MFYVESKIIQFYSDRTPSLFEAALETGSHFRYITSSLLHLRGKIKAQKHFENCVGFFKTENLSLQDHLK